MDPHRVQVGPTPCLGWTHTVSRVGPTLCPRLDLPHSLVPGAASFPGPRYCLIPWSQVLPHTQVPGAASYPGPRYCLIPWSQVLPHTLVPCTASYSGPKNIKIAWAHNLTHMRAQNISTTAPGPKFRDLQASQNTCGPIWSQKGPSELPWGGVRTPPGGNSNSLLGDFELTPRGPVSVSLVPRN